MAFVVALPVRAAASRRRRTSCARAPPLMAVSRPVVWIRDGDCRTVDHPALAAVAADADATAAAVVAHADNDADLLDALRAALRKRGVPLTVTRGDDEAEAVGAFARRFGATDVHVRLDVTEDSRELVQRAARALPSNVALRTWTDAYRTWDEAVLADVPCEYPDYKRWRDNLRPPIEAVADIGTLPTAQLGDVPPDAPRATRSEGRTQLDDFMRLYAADSQLTNAVVVDRGNMDADAYGEAMVRAFLASSDRGEEPDLARSLAPVLRHGLLSMRRIREVAVEHERANARLWRPVYAFGAAQLLEYLDAREYAQLLASADLAARRTVDGAQPARFCRVEGLLVRYVAEGNASSGRPPVVLVHGFGASAQHWGGAVPLLARAGYRVYALDLPGYGRSEKPGPTRYTPHFWQHALTCFVRDVVRAPAVVAGNSIGGYFAAAFAADLHPQLCAGVVLLNSAGKIVNPNAPAEPKPQGPLAAARNVVREWRPARLLAANVLLRSLRGSIQKTLRAVYPTHPERADLALAEEIRRNSLDYGADFVLASGLALPPQRTLSKLLAMYDGPMLVYHGELDPLGAGRGRAEQIQAAYPAATVVRRQLGHCPHDEDPVDFAHTLVDWMDAECGVTSHEEVEAEASTATSR